VLDEPRLNVVFFKTLTGNEPVRDWLKSLSLQDKKVIGEDINQLNLVGR